MKLRDEIKEVYQMLRAHRDELISLLLYNHNNNNNNNNANNRLMELIMDNLQLI